MSGRTNEKMKASVALVVTEQIDDSGAQHAFASEHAAMTFTRQQRHMKAPPILRFESPAYKMSRVIFIHLDRWDTAQQRSGCSRNVRVSQGRWKAKLLWGKQLIDRDRDG